MNVKCIITVVLSFWGILFVSCSDSWPYSEELYNETWINVYPSSISLDEDQLSDDFTINCTHRWSIYDYPSWIHIYDTYGYYYSTVSFTVDENTGNYNRYGYIRVRTDDGFVKETSVYVTQPPTLQFDATMSTTNYKAEGDYWFLKVTAPSSKSWTISKSVSWVHLGTSSNTSNSYSGTGNASISIYADANSSSYTRSTTLTVKCGTKTKSITITQDKASNTVTLTVSPTSVSLGWRETTNSATFSITSTTDWKITKSSDATWLTVSPMSGSGNRTITLSAPYYSGWSGRDATLSITTTKGTSITRTVSVHQN